MAEIASFFSVAITTFLVVILTRAAWHKFDAYLETIGFAQGYDLVPEAWVPGILRALMLAEAAAVLALLLPQTRMFGGLLAAGLFAGYGLLMALALSQGKREIDCGCGGLPQVVSGFTLARNGVLVALALFVSTFHDVLLRPLEAAVAIGGGLVLAMIYAVIERLASHIPHIRQKEI